MTEQRVSSRYARAILTTASDEGLADTIFEDFRIISAIIDESRELENMLKSPIIRFWKKKKIFEEIFKPHVNDLTMKFILLLGDKHREGMIDSIIAQYEIQYNKLNNKLPITISSAVELSDEIKKNVIRKLEDISKKTVIPYFKIDSDLKGGILVKIEDWVFDASIKNQLEVLFKKLSSN